MYKTMLLALFFGAMTKYADLMNEHGLEPPFKGARLLSGILWGLLGSLLITIDVQIATFYIALVLYWILKIKLDYHNHAIGGVMMLIAGFFKLSFSPLYHFQMDLVLLILAYVIFGLIHSLCKKYHLSKKIIQALRIRFYLIPLAYSIWISNSAPFIAAFMGLVGVEFVTYLHRNYETTRRASTPT